MSILNVSHQAVVKYKRRIFDQCHWDAGNDTEPHTHSINKSMTNGTKLFFALKINRTQNT